MKGKIDERYYNSEKNSKGKDEWKSKGITIPSEICFKGQTHGWSQTWFCPNCNHEPSSPYLKFYGGLGSINLSCYQFTIFCFTGYQENDCTIIFGVLVYPINVWEETSNQDFTAMADSQW